MDIANFTPVSALIGGALIGLAATLLLWLNGRVAGVSGILGGLLPPSGRGESGWRIMFLIGLVGGGLGYSLAGGAGEPHIEFVSGVPMLIIAGLLVGVGTRVGSGCTSGHGICGIARLSPRSIVATLIFVITAAVTVYIVRHVVGA